MEIKKKIAVCGDSYCVAELISDDRLHFSQVLEDRYGYDILPLALAGCSNTCIAFQIQAAIKLDADIVIYNMTFPSRIDIVMAPEYVNFSQGIKNFAYPFTNDTGYDTIHVGNRFAPIFSTTIDGLDSKFGMVEKLTQQHVDAAKSYLLNFYHHSWKQEIDSWILAYWHQQIIDAGKLPIPLINNSPVKVEFDPELGQAIYDFTKNNPDYPRVYHTDGLSQQITAEKIHQHIKKKLT